MWNNAQLKETLSHKVTASAGDAHSGSRTSSRQDETINSLTPPTLRIVLTFSLPFADLQSQIERIDRLIQSLGLARSVQYQAKPALFIPPSPPVIPEPGRATASSSIGESSVSNATAAAMTDKQKKMLYALVAKKKLSADEITNIMDREFGHSGGASLTKIEASRLISLLMEK